MVVGSARGRLTRVLVILLGLAWVAFQLSIIVNPREPLIERSIHLVFAQALVFLTIPLQSPRLGPRLAALVDRACIAGVVALGIYYYLSAGRLVNRIEIVDPILLVDVVFGAVAIVLLLEGVRRTVGWSLLSLLLFTLLYGFTGPWFPGWSRFRGFGLDEAVEILTMTTNGVLGLTTETSVQFIFYFIVFGVVYSAIGGGRLFIDIGLAVSGRQQGGAAKAAVVSSSLMGTISGSAVANAMSVGVFTIPLMRRAGYSRAQAAGIEAISSTGGQLMPPVMGVAAFVMAEMLQVDYARIALAAIIPALAFYFALFVVIDLGARRSGVGTLPPDEIRPQQPIPPRLYLLAPPLLLVTMLVAGYSATISVIGATASCVVTCYLRRESRMGLRDWIRAVEGIGRQAAQVAVPIAAIGIVIAIAIESNLALRFSTRLIEGGGENLIVALVLTIIGCVIMGMGLPTVAAYIVGAILFAPALLKLGVAPLVAHFFVMYYCVLSMVTPPVALASFAAAGLAGAGAMQTGWVAFRLSIVLFLIPFAFVFDPALLGQAPAGTVLLAFSSLLLATAAWAVALAGYLRRPLATFERLAWGAAAAFAILFPTGSALWGGALAVLAGLAFWSAILRPQMPAARRTGAEEKIAARMDGR